jgi:hypothetical protein
MIKKGNIIYINKGYSSLIVELFEINQIYEELISKECNSYKLSRILKIKLNYY